MDIEGRRSVINQLVQQKLGDLGDIYALTAEPQEL